MDQHERQKERLGESMREMMRLDKQHIQEQLKVIKRVKGKAMSGKRAREQEAQSSTMKGEEGREGKEQGMKEIFQ